MSPTQPLMDRGVQSISAIKHIRMRHCGEVFLSHASRILPRAVGVKWRSRNLSIRTIGLRRRVGHGPEDAEVTQLAGVGASVWIRCRPHGIPERVHRRDDRGRRRRICRSQGVPVSPPFPVAEDAVSGAVREHRRPRGLPLPFKLLVVQCKKERFVANDRTAGTHCCLVAIDPGGLSRLPDAVNDLHDCWTTCSHPAPNCAPTTRRRRAARWCRIL